MYDNEGNLTGNTVGGCMVLITTILFTIPAFIFAPAEWRQGMAVTLPVMLIVLFLAVRIDWDNSK